MKCYIDSFALVNGVKFFSFISHLMLPVALAVKARDQPPQCPPPLRSSALQFYHHRGFTVFFLPLLKQGVWGRRADMSVRCLWEAAPDKQLSVRWALHISTVGGSIRISFENRAVYNPQMELIHMSLLIFLSLIPWESLQFVAKKELRWC